MTDEATTTSGAQAGTPVLRLSGITKRFGPLVANDAISFELGRGEVVALLGENGAGKTTLMNILFGHYVADEGTVEVFGDRLPPGDPHAALEAGIGMVHQHFTLADNMTVLENIALGTQPVWSLRLDRGRARARIAELSADFGLAVDPGRLVSALSVGERQRVEILKALYRDARILILDEPTAVLTPAETEALFATLRMLVAKGLSIIFISHKLNEVMAVSDRVLVLRGGEIVGLAGVSGNGQAALAALLAGMVGPASGSLEIGGRQVTSWTPRAALAAGVGRIPEDRHAVGTIGDMSVAENVISERYRDARFSSRGFLDWSAARGFAQSIVDAYDVKCPSPDARIRLLSGGNMQKLILGRALDPDPSLILANQPTRGLDVGAVSYVHERLLEARGRGAAILLISEDLDEILTLSDRIVVMSRGRLSAPSARGERSVAELGELMAGHGLDTGERGHAA